jgi:hypothetical protein
LQRHADQLRLDAGFWISNIGPTTFRVNFTDPGASKTFRWTASVADA